MNSKLTSIHSTLTNFLPPLLSDLPDISDKDFLIFFDNLHIFYKIAIQALEQYADDTNDPIFMKLDTQLHGGDHWFRVFFYGCVLLYYSGIEDNDYFIAHLLAACTHDTCRTHDKRCKIHGVIAAEHVSNIANIMQLDNPFVDHVRLGVTVHCTSLGHPSTDLDYPLSVRILCDSDRLDRIRCTKRADESFLFSSLAKNINRMKSEDGYFVERIFMLSKLIFK